MSTSYLKKGDVQNPVDRKTVNLAKKGWEIKQKIVELEGQLKAVNDKIIDQVPAGFTIVIPGLVQIPVAETQRFSITNPDAVRSVLKTRFDDLVDTKTSYTLTKKLKEMVLSGDDQDGLAIRAYIGDKTTVALRYLAAKPVKSTSAIKLFQKSSFTD